jgi:hypothetical protein
MFLLISKIRFSTALLLNLLCDSGIRTSGKSANDLKAKEYFEKATAAEAIVVL